jgi:hypothetical protein
LQKKYKLKDYLLKLKIISRNNIKESCKKLHVVIFRFLYSSTSNVSIYAGIRAEKNIHTKPFNW